MERDLWQAEQPEQQVAGLPFSLLEYTRLTCTRKEGIIQVINTFADKETEKVFFQVFSKKLPQSIQHIALRKLMMLDAAEALEDLRIPPSNHLERLQGDREGQYSIRVNRQYRICFEMSGKDVYDVEIVDYH